MFKKTKRVRDNVEERKLKGGGQESRKETLPITSNALEQALKTHFGQTVDLTKEEVIIGGIDGRIIYLTTMTNSPVITEKISDQITMAKDVTIDSEVEWNRFCKKTFSGANMEMVEFEEDMVERILDGYVIITLEGMTSAAAVHISAQEKRSIEEPTTQTIIRGPKEGFVEDVETNVKLVRRRVKNKQMRLEKHILGSETSTKVYLVYIDNIVNKKILAEVKERIAKMKTNAVFESHTVEEFITDKVFTPFPLIFNTERPDAASAHLLSGKVIVFIDGSPFVLSMPAMLNDFVATTEDYYQPFLMGSFLRILRYICFFLALLLPAFYVGIITYHHEMIPTSLIISIVTQREGIPFPAVIEALIMEITFEILREAGVRMPRAVGGTISIVGGLVIGQAAVEAGIVSHIMVIVVALTAISSFVLPVYSFAIGVRLLRFVFILLAGTFGLYGIVLGLIIMVAHMASLRSFGTPYLTPFSPFVLAEHKDTFLRFPMWAMKTRPVGLRTQQAEKQPEAQPPSPSKGGSG